MGEYRKEPFDGSYYRGSFTESTDGEIYFDEEGLSFNPKDKNIPMIENLIKYSEIIEVESRNYLGFIPMGMAIYTSDGLKHKFAIFEFTERKSIIEFLTTKMNEQKQDIKNNEKYEEVEDNRMTKIIMISDTTISIGMNDGSIKEISVNDINFVPHIGDEVEIFTTNNKIIVSKVEKKNDTPNGSINVSVQNAPNHQPYYIASGILVNKVIYCLLAFFLGGLGIHKFYAGKIGTGILFLIFSWTFIPVIISLIEFIVALFKKSDSAGNILV